MKDMIRMRIYFINREHESPSAALREVRALEGCPQALRIRWGAWPGPPQRPWQLEVREESRVAVRPILAEAKGLLDSETHSPSSSSCINSVNAKLSSGTGSPSLMQKTPHWGVPKNIHHQTLVAVQEVSPQPTIS